MCMFLYCSLLRSSEGFFHEASRIFAEKGLLREGIVKPVGAGVGMCGVGTLASPWLEGEGAHQTRTRATQASPPPIHTTPAPTDLTMPLLKYTPPLAVQRSLLP